MEMKKSNQMLEIWVYLGVIFKGLRIQKDTQTPCWLRPWCRDSLIQSQLSMHLVKFMLCGSRFGEYRIARKYSKAVNPQ